jgi:hypothetical protein
MARDAARASDIYLAQRAEGHSLRGQRLPMVAVNLWYHVGPANETPARTGFAHLFDHMMFQGSKHVAADTHFKLLEAAGASDINGTTDFDRTNYFETVPSNQLELALWIESDRMGYLLDVVDQKAAGESDRRRAQRAAAERREPGVRRGPGGAVLRPLSGEASVLCIGDRFSRRHRRSEARRRAAVLQAVLHAQAVGPASSAASCARSRGTSALMAHAQFSRE